MADYGQDLSALNMLSQVVPIKLNGTNYAVWQKLMKNYIASYRRLHYIEGIDTPPPRQIIVNQPTDSKRDHEE